MSVGRRCWVRVFSVWHSPEAWQYTSIKYNYRQIRSFGNGCQTPFNLWQWQRRYHEISNIAILFTRGLPYTCCIGLRRYYCSYHVFRYSGYSGFFVEYLRQFLIDLNLTYRRSSVPQNTSPWIFLSFLAPAVSEHGAAATFFWSCCACHGVANPSTASH